MKCWIFFISFCLFCCNLKRPGHCWPFISRSTNQASNTEKVIVPKFDSKILIALPSAAARIYKAAATKLVLGAIIISGSLRHNHQHWYTGAGYRPGPRRRVGCRPSGCDPACRMYVPLGMYRSIPMLLFGLLKGVPVQGCGCQRGLSVSSGSRGH